MTLFARQGVLESCEGDIHTDRIAVLEAIADHLVHTIKLWKITKSAPLVAVLEFRSGGIARSLRVTPWAGLNRDHCTASTTPTCPALP